MDRFFRTIILVALVVVIGCAAFMGYRVFMGSQGAPLPPLTHRSVVDAMAELEKMGLKARVESERSAFPQGTVVAQNPQPGVKVRPESIVTLTVSGGTSRVQLPDFRGLVADEAVRQIKEAGFPLGDQIHVPSTKPAGTVIAQEPAAPGSVALTQPINLMISTGSTTASGGVQLPDMVQRDVEEAKALLQQSGLKSGVQYEYTTDSPAGLVLAMSPRAGATVPKGARVTLTVASQNKDHAPAVEEVTPAEPTEPTPSTDGAVVVTVPEETGVVNAPAEPAKPTQPVEEKPKENAKIAKIRYQVPPVNGMSVKVELSDVTGTKTILTRPVKGGETLRLDAPYQGKAVVTIYLGGEFVWQDQYK